MAVSAPAHEIGWQISIQRIYVSRVRDFVGFC